MNNLPIGVFDSGVGGLTVLKQCQQLLPNESFIYLGDTARLPYGTKSPETVQKYATQVAKILVQRGVKALVIACNTASAVSLPTVQHAFPDLPVLGVLQPGAQAAVTATNNNTIAVIATEATIKAEGYHKAIKQLSPDSTVVARDCGLFVALAEEGWGEHAVAKQVAQEYLTPLFTDSNIKPDTLVLGCTHFPILIPAIADVVGSDVTIIDSDHASATALVNLLRNKQLLSDAVDRDIKKHFLVTDSPRRFQRIAHYFLKQDINIDDIELVDVSGGS